ncbi:MAG: ATP-binding protein [Actinobacteria bacterium]|nr:ATP-binding protein [Actinomycetota bacterium]
MPVLPRMNAGMPVSGGRLTTTLACESTSTRMARQIVRTALLEAGQSQWTDAAELACSEVVTNAILHAHTAIEVTVDVEPDHVRVEVRDFSPVLPVQRDYNEQATTGRGMALVAALTRDHGISDVGPDGKTVWFTIGGVLEEQSDEALLAAWDDAEWDLDGVTGDVPSTTLGTTTACLLGLPPTLWLAARQHHDALLRELVLYLAEHPGLEVDVPATDRARSVVSNAVLAAIEHAQRAGTARRVLPEGHPSPLADVPEPLDLQLEISADLGPAFGAMQDTLDAAEGLAGQGRLLARPALPEIIAVRDWACEQITAQLDGVPPSPWPGADQDRFTVDVHERDSEPDLGGWDIGVVRDSDRGVVAADDANRIVAVSRPLADFVGWDVDDLVGRRVVTLIPPRLREAHVSGYTRHLTTGEAHVLDIPLVLPVLRADGTEVPASFLVQQAPMARGRTMYLAWIEPVPVDGGEGLGSPLT